MTTQSLGSSVFLLLLFFFSLKLVAPASCFCPCFTLFKVLHPPALEAGQASPYHQGAGVHSVLIGPRGRIWTCQ